MFSSLSSFNKHSKHHLVSASYSLGVQSGETGWSRRCESRNDKVLLKDEDEYESNRDDVD